MAGYQIFTYGLFTLNSLSSLWKRKKQEIHEYLNGNKKEGSLVGAEHWSTFLEEKLNDNSRKNVQKQLVSGKIEKSLAFLF